MTDDLAVSNVLGAIMVVALMLTFMIRVDTEFEPRWEEEAEAAHLEELLSQFADLKAQTDKQTDNRTLAPVINPLLLGPRPSTAMLADKPAIGALYFDSTGFNTTFTSPRLFLIEKNGKPLGALTELWTEAQTSSDILQISRLDSLRIRLTGQESDKLELKADAFVDIEVTDANGVYAGGYRAYVPPKDKLDIWARILTSTGEVLVDQELASDVKYKEHNRFWIDVLDASWPFRQVLDAAEGPVDLQLTWGFPDISDPAKWPEVEFATSYVTIADSGQDVFVGGSNSGITDFAQTKQGGRLEYAIEYRELPPVTIVLEHGALILAQPDGAGMVLKPAFSVSRSGAMTIVDIVAPTYHGDTGSHGGKSSATVTSRATGTSALLGTTAEFTWTIDTDYPQVWVDFLRARLDGADLAEGTEYLLDPGARSVEVTVIGTSTAESTHDVQVRLDQPRIVMDVD